MPFIYSADGSLDLYFRRSAALCARCVRTSYSVKRLVDEGEKTCVGFSAKLGGLKKGSMAP